jgi:activator of HSP90 ATPase
MKAPACLALLPLSAALLAACSADHTQAAKARGLTSPTTIHQEVVLKATPHRIYQALTDARQFQVFSGHPVSELSPDPGGPFSLFGGLISGRQIELVPDERIVQAWHEPVWGPGIYSIARFQLKPEGPATRIIFDHQGFPTGAGPHLTIGWNEHYWEPLAKYLEREQATGK